MKRVSIRLPDELYEKLRWLAYTERCSQHSIILGLLEKGMKAVHPPKEENREQR
jgi:hypothetical protein